MIDRLLSGWCGRSLLVTLLVVLIAFPWLAGEGERFYTVLLMTVFIFATFGHAWNLLAGYSGLLSFGLQVYVGLGGFAIGLLSFYGEVNVWLAMPVAAVVSILFAWLLAIPVSERFTGKRAIGPMAIAVGLWILYEFLITFEPSFDVFRGHYTRRVFILLLIFLGALPLLKLQGAYFAVATWLIASAMASVFSEWKVTGAGGGLSIVSDTSVTARYYAGLILVVASTFVVWYLLNSRYGQALTAVRDDEEAASTIGIDIRRVKTLVFLVSAPMAGLAAGLFYIDNVTITPADAFSIRWSAVVVFVVVAGGMGSLPGPIIGAVIFVLVDRLASGYIGSGELALGIASVLIIILFPRGIMGSLNDLRTKAREKPVSNTLVMHNGLDDMAEPNQIVEEDVRENSTTRRMGQTPRI
jgi:branched-chain amino acid transport system permease protein